jgi:hypothetical protein
MRFAATAWLMPLFAFLVLLTGCASVPGTVEISRAQLQAALERRFPYEARPAAGLILVRVGAPRLQLLPAENRIRLDFDVEASERISRNAGHGALALSFGLRYETSDASLRATSVRVDDVQVQGLTPEWRAPLQFAGGLVAENLLQNTVLHTFRPEDLKKSRGWTPGEIRVTPRGVRITLVPPSAAMPASVLVVR